MSRTDNSQQPPSSRMNMNEKSRLDRIEEKIDKMAEAVIALARAEEKIFGLSETSHIILKRLVEYDNRMRAVERQSSESASKLRSITMFFWTIVTAISMSVVGAISWFGADK
jgi:hypothetical protein